MCKILLIILMACSASSYAEASKRGADNLSSHVSKVLTSNLAKTYEKEGLDAVVKNFYEASQTVKVKYKNSKKNKKGLRVKDKEGRKVLVQLIQSAQYITDKIDIGNMHHYALSLLYKEMPKDFSLALERSGLTAEQKQDMLASLKQNINMED